MDLFKLNRILAGVMAVILLGAGLIGQRIGVSTSTAYDVFHIIFGLIALAAALLQGGRHAWLFNVVFGAIDLYQAIAQLTGWFPAQLFALTSLDTGLHVVIGGVLFVAGALCYRQSRTANLSGA